MGLIKRSSYYQEDYRQAAALIRARQPFLIKNIIGGVSLFAFAIGIYAYTIKAISQDDFSDVPMPDAPSQPPHTPNVGVTKAISIEAFKKND